MKTKLKGSTECPFLDARMWIVLSTKKFCINPTIVTDWNILEKDIVRDAKCLNILLWRGISGGKYRSYFTERDLKFSHSTIQFGLKPSKLIQNEVDRFRKEFLPDRFIAINLRAELILLPSSYDFNLFRKCIDVIATTKQKIKLLNIIYYYIHKHWI